MKKKRAVIIDEANISVRETKQPFEKPFILPSNILKYATNCIFIFLDVHTISEVLYTPVKKKNKFETSTTHM